MAGSASRLALALALCLPPLLDLLPRMAAADTPRFSVPTYVDPCVPIDRRKFQELLAVELGATPDYGKLERANGSARVSLTCVDGQVQLELDDDVTRKSMRRRVDLLRVDPETRTRLMALTTAEFVLASWLEIRLDKQHDALEPSVELDPASTKRTDRLRPRRRRAASSIAIASVIRDVSSGSGDCSVRGGWSRPSKKSLRMTARPYRS